MSADENIGVQLLFADPADLRRWADEIAANCQECPGGACVGAARLREQAVMNDAASGYARAMATPPTTKKARRRR